MAEILMAAQSAAVTLEDGIPHMIEAGRTMAHADHPIVTRCPSLWQSLKVHYSTDAPESEPEKEPEPEPEQPAAADAPDAKAIRAWAAEQGIDVPKRGALPGAVVEQYQAAHSEA